MILAFGAPAHAQTLRLEPRAVVELFTSQGCSSCPPADKILSELGDGPDIVALAYHVDYWDYIGWKDTFGSTQNANLQRAYASAQHKANIYTPQMIINGVDDIVGSRRSDILNTVSQTALPVPIGLTTDGDYLEVNIAGDQSQNESTVWLVTFQQNAEVEIQRGENSGRTITYSSIVTGRQALGMWEPDSGAHIKLPLHDILRDPSDGVAILVQEEIGGLPGPILGAASFAR